jgi:hypothetical protein
MKKFIAIFIGVLLVAGAFTGSVEAKTIKVKSYYKPSVGKYINSYYKTSPNKTRLDNYSTKGNSNPFTGKKGYAKSYKW